MANGGKQVANDGKTMLLQRAVESAKNRVYYIDVNSMGDISYHHHKKAENQKELMNITVDALEKQIPKKPYLDNDNGFYEKEHCPTCHRSLFPNDHHCRCGQALDWSDTE
jgi:hypothetical protein